MALQSRGQITQQIKINLQFSQAYAHQTLQGVGSRYGAINHKVVWSFDHVVKKGYTENKKLYIHFFQACDHQSWKGGDFWWGAIMYKVTLPFGDVKLSTNPQSPWPFGQKVMLDYVRDTKQDKLVACSAKLLL